MISIIDYGVGNVGSIKNMLVRAGCDSQIIQTREDVLQATKIILPGVGAFDPAMTALKSLNLVDALKFKAIDEKIPFLGICLGMQILFESSEEGSEKGLALIPGVVKRFDKNLKIRIPHMGWNSIKPCSSSRVLHGLEGARFYFVHSFHAECESQSNVLATTIYGREFTSCAINENIVGVQFHPEKSHKFGMRLLSNFAGV